MNKPIFQTAQYGAFINPKCIHNPTVDLLTRSVNTRAETARGYVIPFLMHPPTYHPNWSPSVHLRKAISLGYPWNNHLHPNVRFYEQSSDHTNYTYKKSSRTHIHGKAAPALLFVRKLFLQLFTPRQRRRRRPFFSCGRQFLPFITYSLVHCEMPYFLTPT